MTYRVEISSIAEAEADSAFLRLAQVTSLRERVNGTVDCSKQLSLYRQCRNDVRLRKKTNILVRRFDNFFTDKDVIRIASCSLF